MRIFKHTVRARNLFDENIKKTKTDLYELYISPLILEKIEDIFKKTINKKLIYDDELRDIKIIKTRTITKKRAIELLNNVVNDLFQSSRFVVLGENLVYLYSFDLNSLYLVVMKSVNDYGFYNGNYIKHQIDFEAPDYVIKRAVSEALRLMLDYDVPSDLIVFSGGE